MLYNKRGFTLIELLVTMSIIILMTGLSLPYFNNFNRTQSRIDAAELIRTSILEAQNMSQAPSENKDKKANSYCLNFYNTNLKAFILTECSELDPNLHKIKNIAFTDSNVSLSPGLYVHKKGNSDNVSSGVASISLRFPILNQGKAVVTTTGGVDGASVDYIKFRLLNKNWSYLTFYPDTLITKIE